MDGYISQAGIWFFIWFAIKITNKPYKNAFHIFFPNEIYIVLSDKSSFYE